MSYNYYVSNLPNLIDILINDVKFANLIHKFSKKPLTTELIYDKIIKPHEKGL